MDFQKFKNIKQKKLIKKEDNKIRKMQGVYRAYEL